LESCSLQDGGAGEGLGDAGGPFGLAGLADAGALAVDGYGDGHVDDFELVNGLPAQVGEGDDGRERNAEILNCGQNDEPWKRYKYGDSGLRSE
jgi:hypothetical protein